MGFFIGTYQHGLDDKNRVIVPSRLRDSIDVSVDGDGLYVSPGSQGCLFLFTRTTWHEAAQVLQDLARREPTVENHNHRRIFFADSEQVMWDRQGRILVSEKLRGRAGLSKDVIFVGNGDRIELWDHVRYKAFYGEAAAKFEEFAQRGF